MERLNLQRRDLANNTHARNTREGYARDWADFSAWCKRAGREPASADADLLALYVTDRLESCRVTTLERRLTGVVFTLRTLGSARPDLQECRAILAGARRQRKEQPRGKAALSVADLRKIGRRLDGRGDNRSVRDWALMLLGFAGALRRSEIAAADVADVSFAKRGLVLRVPSSKTDQEGVGMTLGIFRGAHEETDPVRALRAWLSLRGMKAGALFTHVTTGDNVTLRRLTHGGVSCVVKSAVAGAGLDPALYSPHSLRAGCVTAAFEGGSPDLSIMRRTGHRSLAMVKRYERSRDPFAGVNPLAKAL